MNTSDRNKLSHYNPLFLSIPTSAKLVTAEETKQLDARIEQARWVCRTIRPLLTDISAKKENSNALDSSNE